MERLTCVEMDGCCYTHSPCFRLVDDPDCGPCAGWPCPEEKHGVVRWRDWRVGAVVVGLGAIIGGAVGWFTYEFVNE